MDYFGIGLCAFPVAIKSNRNLTEAEKEELYFRYKDNHQDEEANRVLNSDIHEKNIDVLLSLAILSRINKEF